MTGDLLSSLPAARKSATLGEAGFDRIELDAYFTEPRCVDALASAIPLPARIWEPCCGDGAIVRALEARGHEVIAHDVHDYGIGAGMHDFLASSGVPPADTIVTNFPYQGGARFVAQALHRVKPHGMVCALFRHEYDCAPVRRHLFRDHPAFAVKLTLSFRPKWRFPKHVEEARIVQARAAGKSLKEESPRFPFAWFIWDWRHTGRPTLVYAP